MRFQGETQLPRSGTVDPIVAELTGVHKKYGSTIALDGINLQIRSGELLAILGPNGAGKSTAVSLLLGLQEPDSGAAELFGISPHLLAARRQVGVMLQEVTLTPELRVRELIEVTAHYYPTPFSVDDVLQMTRTTALAARPYGKLSGGQKRLVQFAMAVCGRPKLLFLDEPTVGLDIQAREAMWTTLRSLVSEGCSIVLTTHYLEEAEALADRVAVLAKGRVVAVGSVKDVRALVARKRIACVSALPPEQIRHWPNVTEVSVRRQRLYITVTDAEAVARQLLNTDATIGELEISSAGLAEAFTELTQEAA
jgi:ABC-2 type transport system ATP-binding protein